MNSVDAFLHGYQLTTVEILYYMPDHPRLLQTFIWQEYDCPPDFPHLQLFLQFWRRSIEGKLFSVRIACDESRFFSHYRQTDLFEWGRH